MRRQFIRASSALVLAAVVSAGSARAAEPVQSLVPQTETPVPFTLAVDATDATRGLLHVREHMTLAPGSHTLVYPKWIPGEHGPNGPIPNLATLVISAGGTKLDWKRDLVDLYAFHIDVPDGGSSVDVSFDYLGAEAGSYSSSRLSTPDLLSLTWNKVVLYPDVPEISAVTVSPTLTLPGADWKFATALTTAQQSGATVTFAPVTLERLIDSPLDAGTNSKRVPLGSIDGAPVDIAIFADTPDELDIADTNFARLRNLVREMGALYHGRHFDHYTFLLTTSDVMPGEGVEHHQSSDDGTDADFLHKPGHLLDAADLLSHEFNHSWDGKFRRPGDLATPNLQTPMIDDLLWVYEGMTQFYGKLQAERSGLLTKQQWLDSLAVTYSRLDTTQGRLTRPLLDTAVAAPYLYSAPRQFARARREVDFYEEGTMMWLEADVIIRQKTGGKKSIDDFARAFFGRTSTGPQVVPYDRADVIAALNEVLPYDWTGFFKSHVDEIAPHPPDPFTPGGYKLVYTDKVSPYEKAADGDRKSFDYSTSLGITINKDTIGDVVLDSPAAIAGLAPGLKILGIDGRSLSDDTRGQIDRALIAARGGAPLTILVSGKDTYREVTIDDRTGPRYPHLERVPSAPDELGAIAAPLPAPGYEPPAKDKKGDAGDDDDDDS